MAGQIPLIDRITGNSINREFQAVLTKLNLTSNAVAVTDVGFGDNGKGRIAHELGIKIKDLTGEPVAAIFKANGSSNSGHEAAGLKLNLLPSGVADTDIGKLILGRGVTADPNKLQWECVPLDAKGYNVTERLLIDERTMLSDVTHRLLDLAKEKWMERTTGEKRGSTGRGVSPSFQAEVSHTQIYYSSFLGTKERFAEQLAVNIDKCEKRIRAEFELSESEWNELFDTLTKTEQRANKDTAHLFDDQEFDFTRFKGDQAFSLNKAAIVDTYWEAGQKVREYIQSASDYVSDSLRANKFVVFEFGQGYLLGKRTGFPPNVTASHTYTSEIFTSAGIPVQEVHNITAAKAYDTKVGTHVFLTELTDEHPLGRKLRKIEYGTTTGRQRMVGWYDAVEKGHTLREGGFQGLVINKLDPLSHEGEWQSDLQICHAYRLEDGSISKKLPMRDEIRKKATPIYESYSGWSEDIADVRSFKDLPLNAQRYVAGMYYHTVDAAYFDRDKIYKDDLPSIDFVGVGPNPGQLIEDIPSPLELLNLLNQT